MHATPELVQVAAAAAVVLLAVRRWRADLVAVIVLAALALARVVTPAEALSGFGHPATLTVGALLVISGGLQASGILRYLGDRLFGLGSPGRASLLLLLALIVVPLSAFVSNTVVVAALLPVLLRTCRTNGISPSFAMMPLSFLAMLGGTCTLVGTSTNVLVSELARDSGLPRLRMFELSLVGLTLLACGALYLVLFGRRLAIERLDAGSLTHGFELQRYLTELVVLEGSPLIGKPPPTEELERRYKLEVYGHSRGKVMRSAPAGYETLLEGDILLVKATVEDLARLREATGLGLLHARPVAPEDLRSADAVVVEAVITPDSNLVGRTLKDIGFRQRFGAAAIAIRRQGEDLRDRIGRLPLQVGDELLILGPPRNVERLREQPNFVVLEELDLPVLRPRRAATAATILGGVVLVAASGWYPLAESAVVGAVLMVLTGCLPAGRVYRAVDWSAVFLLAGLIPLGALLASSGAAARLGGSLLSFVPWDGPGVALAVFFAAVLLLTGLIPNNAAAILAVPIGLACAERLGVNGRPFVVAVAFAASAAFWTPVGYQTNLLVFAPGGYRGADFLRMGGPLAALSAAVGIWLIPRLFPF